MAEDPQPVLPRTLDLKTILLGATALAGTFIGIVDPLHIQRDERVDERQWEIIGKHRDEISQLKSITERNREQVRENKDEIRELRREIEEIRKGFSYEYRASAKRKSDRE